MVVRPMAQPPDPADTAAFMIVGWGPSNRTLEIETTHWMCDTYPRIPMLR